MASASAVIMHRSIAPPLAMAERFAHKVHVLKDEFAGYLVVDKDLARKYHIEYAYTDAANFSNTAGCSRFSPRS